MSATTLSPSSSKDASLGLALQRARAAVEKAEAAVAKRNSESTTVPPWPPRPQLTLIRGGRAD